MQGDKAWFIFQKLKYMCDMSEKKQFRAVDFPISEPFGVYNESRGLDDATIADAKVVYSNNAWVVTDILSKFVKAKTGLCQFSIY